MSQPLLLDEMFSDSIAQHLDGRYRAAGQTHSGLALVSTKLSPEPSIHNGCYGLPFDAA